MDVGTGQAVTLSRVYGNWRCWDDGELYRRNEVSCLLCKQA